MCVWPALSFVSYTYKQFVTLRRMLLKMRLARKLLRLLVLDIQWTKYKYPSQKASLVFYPKQKVDTPFQILGVSYSLIGQNFTAKL